MTIEAFASVERIAAPSPAVFEARYRKTSTPVVFRGLLDDWPARHWSPALLKARCGARMVPSIATRDGLLKHDATAGVLYEPIELGRFVDTLESGSRDGRYLTFPIEEHLPELAGDLRAFPYARNAPWQRSRIWFGPGGAAAPMHRDLAENLYAQIYGHKRMYLFPRESTRRMYPYSWNSSIPNFGQVDAEAPDYERHPAFAGACGLRVDLEPGDVLYLPSLWWHQTRSLDTSISLNVWYAKAEPLLSIVRVAELYKRVRGIRN